MVWWWWQMMNEVDGMRQEDYSKDWVMHTGKSDAWLWEKMRVDKRWWWEMMNKCGQEGEQRSGYGDKQVEQWRESCMWETESYIRYVPWLLVPPQDVKLIKLEGTHRVQTHAELLYFSPIASNFDFWPFNPKTMSRLGYSKVIPYFIPSLNNSDHSFMSYAADKQTNRLTRKSYRRRPTYDMRTNKQVNKQTDGHEHSRRG